MLQTVAAMPVNIGAWSWLSLTVLILVILVDIVLFVVALITAMGGGYARTAPIEPPPSPPDGSIAAEYRAAIREAQGLPPDEPEESTDDAPEAPTEPPPAVPRRKTGLAQMLAALAAPILVFLVWNYVDNPAGRMQGFTFGAALCLALLAGQFVFIRWYIKLRRRL